MEPVIHKYFPSFLYSISHGLIYGLSILFFSLSTLVTPSFALPEDRELPIDITSDEGEYHQEEGFGIYTGNVVFTQGKLEIKADKATFYLKDGALDYVKAEMLTKGKRVHIKDLPNKEDEWAYGKGEVLHYYPNKELLVLEVQAEVEQGGDIIKADTIDYHLDTKKAIAKRSENKQIQITIQTGKDKK